MSKTFHYDDTLGFVHRTLRYGNAPTIIESTIGQLRPGSQRSRGGRVMICKKCAHESYCDMAQFGGHVPPITACPKFKEKLQTNADRIRAMSDEELMLWLYGYADGSGKTREQWIEWLKEEADK